MQQQQQFLQSLQQLNLYGGDQLMQSNSAYPSAYLPNQPLLIGGYIPSFSLPSDLYSTSMSGYISGLENELSTLSGTYG